MPIDGRASGQGRVFQTSGAQHIEEHHHHYGAGTGSLLAPQPVGPRPPHGATVPDSVRVPLVGRAPGILRDRADLMERLRTAVTGPGGDVHVLHGLGGCGKTAVAHALFTEAVRDHGRVGLWVNASERISLRAGMLAVAGDRGATTGELAAAASGQRAAADLVWHYLDHSAQRWLLVLDNADDPTVLEEGGWLRTSPLGTVLVTTRHATSPLWRGIGSASHSLGVLPLDDAAQVLCDLAPDAGTAESARKVARRLGCLPLALTLAGSHLSHQLLESWSMDEYDRKLSEDSTALVDQGAAGTGSGRSRHLVGRTWQLSLDALAGQGLPEATTLLRLLSCWAADPVPLSLLMPVARGEVDFGHLAPPLAADRVEPALRGLLDHSLIGMVEADGRRCVQAHGVLLDSVAAGVPEVQRGVLAEAAGRLLEAALPPDEAVPAETYTGWELLAPHVTRLLRAAPGERSAVLMVRVARQMQHAGNFAGALRHARYAADAAERTLSGEHSVTLSAHDAEARALLFLARRTDAEALHRRIWTVRRRVLGEDHPETLWSCTGLAMAVRLLDRSEEAEQLLRQAAVTQRRVLGADALETFLSRSLLVLTLSALDKREQFDEEAARLLEDCERFLPPDHLSALMVRHNYGDALRALGRYAEAEPVARRALADQARVQGQDHPLALAALSLTARVAHGLGKYDEAIAALKELIERRERALGPEHPFIAENREWLAAWQAEAETQP
ncbi:tetratricopeptide repeat protein [Streptomyces sp. SID8361]|uniref:tetratricopeptide repeat protein n=1 Tax=Streptomyces sp. MnatMP-M27 TaxID=1839768 RepID=UPI00081D7960|nr:tetratricopeptide repeat protein [Streptomyces sp. MnatMP-M27]MYU12810.1 tetratricopeptide repeat protein [Streptomyces sp. SID8361]SCF95258.1 Tetratricopeptide repeat-containing protein [Streptomyces sp. MnatMP-M27]